MDIESDSHPLREAAGADLESSFPPPPHDPRERVEIGHLSGWEVRAFRKDGVKHRYFAPRGMLHVQLWHSTARVSILTPSRLTLGRYEAYPIANWKFAHVNLSSIRAIVRSVHGVELPPPAQVRALERWHVAPVLSGAATQPPTPPR